MEINVVFPIRAAQRVEYEQITKQNDGLGTIREKEARPDGDRREPRSGREKKVVSNRQP